MKFNFKCTFCGHTDIITLITIKEHLGKLLNGKFSVQEGISHTKQEVIEFDHEDVLLDLGKIYYRYQCNECGLPLGETPKELFEYLKSHNMVECDEGNNV
jgi:hypothetical protein